jgi:isopentenyldiphosphate isomerase
MGQRYLKEVSFNDNQLTQMRNSMKSLFYLFAAHTILVFYSTFFMSKAAWAFISGGLFYILFGAYFVYEIIRQKRMKPTVIQNNTEEWVPLVTDTGSVTGQAPRSQVHNGSKLLHPVIHLHVFNQNKAILLQKRPMSKLIQPGKWDTAVGGHISAGETIEQALQKEAREEIGLLQFSAKLLKFYRWDCDAESELVYLFITYDHKNVKPQSDEVDELRFWTKNQIEKQLGQDIFTPNFELEFAMLKELKII